MLMLPSSICTELHCTGTAGYGYEGTAAYATSQLTFMDIGNIHVMRQSLSRLEQLALSPQAADARWSALVEDTVSAVTAATNGYCKARFQ
jgi:Myotubularin-like phosphatase domain